MSQACPSGPKTPAGLSLSPKPRKIRRDQRVAIRKPLTSPAPCSQNSGQPCKSRRRRPVAGAARHETPRHSLEPYDARSADPKPTPPPWRSARRRCRRPSLDEIAVVALAHDADDRLGAGRADDQPAALPRPALASSITATMPSLERQRLALCETRTFFRICGSGSKRWQTSLTGLPMLLDHGEDLQRRDAGRRRWWCSPTG